MTQQEIIDMARRSGAHLELSTTPGKDIAFLTRFADLVEAKAAKAEREACAQLCETAPDGLQNSTFNGVAAAIRARGTP